MTDIDTSPATVTDDWWDQYRRNTTVALHAAGVSDPAIVAIAVDVSVQRTKGALRAALGSNDTTDVQRIADEIDGYPGEIMHNGHRTLSTLAANLGVMLRR